MATEATDESTPIVGLVINSEQEEEEDDEEPEHRARLASASLGSSYEVINSATRRGSSNSYSSGSDLTTSTNVVSPPPPPALKISLVGRSNHRSSGKRKRNVSFAGTDAPVTQMDLREAGSVLRPGHVPSSGIAEGLGPPQRPPSILRCEKGEDVYVLYEEEEEEEEEGGAGESKPPSSHTLYPAKIRTIPGRSLSPSFANNSVYSMVSTGGGVIDGRFSFSAGTPGDGFVDVEVPVGGYGPASISIDLETCKRTVLMPYLLFLKVIGWRKLRDEGTGTHKCSRCITVINFLYPLFIFAMLILALVSQILTCFYRDQPVYYNETDRNQVLIGRHSMAVVCTDNLVTKLIFPDLLLLVTYLRGLYIFRYGEPEHLAAIMETVFLSANAQHVKSRKRKLIIILRSLLLLGCAWLIYDIIVNIGRGFSLGVFYPNVNIGSISFYPVRYVFVATTFLGFVFFDMVYLSVIITYASQSELIQFYIMGIIDKVNTKAYTLEDAMKDIHRTYDYLQVMNGKLATLTTLCLLIFLEQMITSVKTVQDISRDATRADKHVLALSVAVGISSVVLWALLVCVPIAQAARLTSKCRQLRRLGLQVRSRPFIYSDTPQLDLDSFLQYTNSTRYTAKLASVPIYPAFVFGALFLIALAGSFWVFAYPAFEFAPWF